MAAGAPKPAAAACPGCGYLLNGPAAGANFCPKCGERLLGPRRDTLTNPWIGQVVADRYRLVALLGEGGMGSVYKAEHVRMGKALAVKVLRGEFARDHAAAARFKSEAQIVSRLSHPNTIGVFDFGEVDSPAAGGAFYLAMEYVPGKDLATVLRDEQKLAEARAARIAAQILGSLAEAHDAGIVHRDVKPGNVMLMQTRSGEDFVKVLDFGIAKLRDDSGSTSSTGTGAIVGTPNYLSPEQARGEALDARADLYSVGALLYELVSGRCPFVAPSPMAVVTAHLTQDPDPLQQVAPQATTQLAGIVHRALQKRPQDRFQSADEMRHALQALLAGRTPDPLPPAHALPDVTGELRIAQRADFEEFERQLRRLKRSRVAGPLTLVTLLALAGGVAWRWPDVYGAVRKSAPQLAALLPDFVRPSDVFDGEEHEPNNLPTQANALPIPPGGHAKMRGHLGAKLSEASGDVDVFRLEVPAAKGQRLALFARWSGEKPGDGIKGLDAALALNAEAKPGPDGSRPAAPLVASVDRGGAGKAESLDGVPVAPGTYFLTVKERHAEADGPVEKPTDWYDLEVWLAPLGPNDAVEPDDKPEAAGKDLRYPEWRELAEKNRLGEGRILRGHLAADDADTFAIGSLGPAESADLVAVIPEAALGLAAKTWIPDAVDLAPPPRDRVRFEPAGSAAPGQILFVKLKSPPRPGAPILLQLRAEKGEGAYDVLALGAGTASGPLLVATIDDLGKAGRTTAALELGAGFARQEPAASARTDALLAAGKLAERVAGMLRAEDVARFARPSELLGGPIFDVTAQNTVRYSGRFEEEVQGQGPLAEEAYFRLIERGASCTSELAARNAQAFLDKYPKSAFAPQARLALARALEDEWWRVGNPKLRARALAAYRETGKLPFDGAAEARERARWLTSRAARRPAAPLSCR